MQSRNVIRLTALVLFSATNAGLANAASLADAAESGSWGLVEELLSESSYIDEAQADGTTALIWAAFHGNAELAAELLAHGADANAVNRYGISALTQAASIGNADTIAVLLEHGADAAAANPEGDTALMLAARTGNLEAVRLLLDGGADVNVKESWHGETALVWAAGENHADVVALLLEHGADIGAKTTEFVWDLEQTGVSSQLPRGGITALANAARENAIEAAEVLLAHGADPNTLDPDGISVLRVAVANQNHDMSILLLDHGADPHDGAFADAVKFRSFPVVRAEKNRLDEATSLDVIERLLVAGVDVNAVPEAPMTRQLWADGMAFPNEPPLYMAAHGADIEMMRLLGEHGATAADAVSSKGETILMAALGIVPHLFGGGGTKAPREAQLALEAGALALELGADVTAVKDHGETALHIAGQEGRADLVPFLLEHGAQLDVKDVRNRMPIDAAEGRPKVPRFVGMATPVTVDKETVEVISAAMAAAGIERVPWVDMEEDIGEYVARFNAAREEAAE